MEIIDQTLRCGDLCRVKTSLKVRTFVFIGFFKKHGMKFYDPYYTGQFLVPEDFVSLQRITLSEGDRVLCGAHFSRKQKGVIAEVSYPARGPINQKQMVMYRVLLDAFPASRAENARNWFNAIDCKKLVKKKKKER